ncbi:MAG: hypothetical protein JJ992_01305 [Planctomycetes bacterium]|nr:hypothetical protein [Planctomycetota bacterium]
MMSHFGRYAPIAFLPAFLCLVAAVAVAANGDAAPPVRTIGEAIQLFVDDVLVADKRGVTRHVHTCEKMTAPVLASERPWEQNGIDQRIYTYGTVLRDADTDLLRMWYNRNNLVMIATSRDGIDWQRPELGLVDFAGSKQNNIVFPYFHSPSVVVNLGVADLQYRYAMLGYSRERSAGYYAAHSSDGLHWTLYPKNPVLPGGDTCTLAFDAASGAYLAFHKRTREYRGHRRRLVYLATSPDMQQWSEPQLTLAPDEIDDRQVEREGGLFSQFYNMSAFPYGDQFLGLVTHFRYAGQPPQKGPLQSGDDGSIDVQLVHSRDGRSWSRCEDRSPVIPTGPHEFDAGCILGVTNLPVVMGDQMWMYYTAITTTHGGYVPRKKITIGLAKWRLDGFVSLSASSDGGFVETVPLRYSGEHLEVNANADGGKLTVELLDEAGHTLPEYSSEECIPLRCDSVRAAILWNKHNRLPNATPVRLRFRLQDTQLFGFRIVSSG